jgi:hypothetical protein
MHSLGPAAPPQFKQVHPSCTLVSCSYFESESAYSLTSEAPPGRLIGCNPCPDIIIDKTPSNWTFLQTYTSHLRAYFHHMKHQTARVREVHNTPNVMAIYALRPATQSPLTSPWRAYVPCQALLRFQLTKQCICSTPESSYPVLCPFHLLISAGTRHHKVFHHSKDNSTQVYRPAWLPAGGNTRLQLCVCPGQLLEGQPQKKAPQSMFCIARCRVQQLGCCRLGMAELARTSENTLLFYTS